MLVSWENKAGLGVAEGAKDQAVFKELLSDFWEGLGLSLVSHGDNKDADPKVLAGVATLLQVVFFSTYVLCCYLQSQTRALSLEQ